MESDETLNPLHRNVRNVELDAHCTDAAVVVKYEFDCSSGIDVENLHCNSQCRRAQKIVRLKDLSKDVDISAVAKYVIKCCPFISERRIPELEQILYYLQKRGTVGTADIPLRTEGSYNDVHPSMISLNEIEDYIEMLYDDIEDKIKGTAFILQLSENTVNVKDLAGNETLVGALTRILKDDWKKSYILAINIVSIFCNFSYYCDFHPILAQHKIGTLCMQLVDFEIKHWNPRFEIHKHNEQLSSKESLVCNKQQAFIAVCFNLLLNLAEDVKLELKMVNRNLLGMLIKLAAEKEISDELSIVVTNFLLKLSLFTENQQVMNDGHIVEKIANLFPIKDEALRRSVLRLLFNLSFEGSVCNQMVSAGLVPQIAPFIDRDECSLNLIYQLSTNDDAKAMIAYTDVIQILMRQLVDGTSSDVSKGLLLNIALEKRNAQLICGSDGSGLDVIATTAFANCDHILVKVLRNIAFHSGPSQMFFSKWARRLLESALSISENGNLGYAVDCLGTVNLLSNLSWSEIIEELSLLSWIESAVSLETEPRYPPDLILQVVILCGTLAQQLNVARLLVPLVGRFIDLLSAQQEDDEIVMQIVYLFYMLITHEELSDSLMDSTAQIGAYLLDLMHDRNLPIRSLCDSALTIIADRSEEWARKMDVERFRWHNAQWLEMVGDSNGVASRDSTVSGSPDSFNVFGIEELLDEPDIFSSNDRFEQDF